MHSTYTYTSPSSFKLVGKLKFLKFVCLLASTFLVGSVSSSQWSLPMHAHAPATTTTISPTNIHSRISSSSSSSSSPLVPYLRARFPPRGGKGKKVRRSLTTSTTTTSSSSSANVNVALSIPQRLLAGGTSRGMAQFLLYPMDALRTLSQTRDGRTLADVGANALVRGCATTSSFAMLIGSIQFAIFGATRDTIGPVPAAALGAAGSCLVSVPQEVIKQRLVTGVYSSFRNAVVTIWTTEGLSGFYSGWKPTVTRNVPFVVMTFTAMDVLKKYRLNQRVRQWEEEYGDGDADADGNGAASVSLSVQDNLIIGIGSSLIAATFTHPADVIKTRMMTQAASKAIPYSSTIDCIQTILKTEGIPSFYSGFKQRSLYMGPLWSIQFAMNGKLTELLKDYNKSQIDDK